MIKNFFIEVSELTSASLKQRYRRTFAGFLWVVLSPIVMFTVQATIFKFVMRIEIEHYFLFLVSGLLPWIFINSTISMCTTTFVNTGMLLKSYKLNPYVFLIANILDNFINFITSFIIILIPILILTDAPNVSVLGLLLAPVNCILLFCGATFSVSILAVFHVFYRDTAFVVQFIMSILFFLTPIFYPVELIPETIRWTVNLNPFYLMIDPFRQSLMGQDMAQYYQAIAKVIGLDICLYFVAVFVWKRSRNEFYLHI